MRPDYSNIQRVEKEEEIEEAKQKRNRDENRFSRKRATKQERKGKQTISHRKGEHSKWTLRVTLCVSLMFKLLRES